MISEPTDQSNGNITSSAVAFGASTVQIAKVGEVTSVAGEGVLLFYLMLGSVSGI